MRPSAYLSSDRQYRYRLLRLWDPGLPDALFVMKNPSKADAERDDPTIRRCVGFAQRWGCGSITVVNLCAYVSTDPRRLKDQDDPIGPANDAWVKSELKAAHGAVGAAWGAVGDRWLHARAVEVLAWSDAWRCLGVTRSGHPRHPLRLAADTPLVPYARWEIGAMG